MRMRVILFGLGIALIAVGRAGAGEHLVTQEAVQGRLVEGPAARTRDIAAVDRLLSSAPATKAARRLGVPVSHVRAALPTLSDGDLVDLAARAKTLEMDPAAGLSHDVNQLLIIFLIVALVILLIKAV